MEVQYSILFDTLKSFETSGFDRYSIRYSQVLMGICALLLHVVWLTEASENPAGGGGESRTRGWYSFFLDQGGVIFRKVLSQLCSIPRRKYVLDKPLKGTIFLRFYPKFVGVKQMVLHFVKRWIWTWIVLKFLVWRVCCKDEQILRWKEEKWWQWGVIDKF